MREFYVLRFTFYASRILFYVPRLFLFLSVRVTCMISSSVNPCSRSHSRFGFSAPVGQTPTHCPQNTHVVSGIDLSKQVPIWVSKPRPAKLIAKVYWASSAHTCTHRQHKTHLA